MEVEKVMEPTRIVQYGDISFVSKNEILSPVALFQKKEVADLSDLLETLIAWSHETFGTEEFTRAKEEFYLLMGKVFHDDPFFNGRMNYFLDYFLFERPLSNPVGNGATPYDAFVKQFLEHQKQSRLPEKNRELVLGLKEHQHSLFLVSKKKKQHLYLKDLLSPDGKITEIADKESLLSYGFDKGTILQSFVFKYEGVNTLSQGIIVHPKRVSRLILKRAKAHQKTDPDCPMKLLSFLASKNISIYRHKNVDERKIYSS